MMSAPLNPFIPLFLARLLIIPFPGVPIRVSSPLVAVMVLTGLLLLTQELSRGGIGL
ncbi:MAG TPA: hypothetical protein VH796_17960 [Nitrososphaeraceae archaeon]|jgi:hypothetical protein